MTDLEKGIIAFSAVSCLFSFCVIYTVLFFPSMRTGSFMRIILYMSLSDFFMNFASAFGFPRDGTSLCWFQGITVNYFSLCSWFWTTLLAYRVYCSVRYRAPSLNQTLMHCIGWGLPAVLTMLPIATTTVKYGASETNTQWCLLQASPQAPPRLIDFWTYATIFIWLFIAIACMLAWQALIAARFRKSAVRDIVRRTYDKVYLYPVAMIVCWMLNFWCDAISTHSGGLLDAVSMVCAISNGLLAAIIFMWKSEEAQRRWWLYLFPPEMSRLEQLVEPTVRLDFEDEDSVLGEGANDSESVSRYRQSSIGLGSVVAPARRGMSNASVVGAVSDISMSDLTVSTAGSNPLQSRV
jgi:hypothetical protein